MTSAVFPWLSTVGGEGKKSFPAIPKTFPASRIVEAKGKLFEISGKLIRRPGKIVFLGIPAAGPEGKTVDPVGKKDFSLGKESGESQRAGKDAGGPMENCS